MTWVAAGVASAAVTAAIIKDQEAKKAKKKQEEAIKNSPKYQISDEAYKNQAIARQQAYGRDSATQIQESQLDQDSANAAYQAANATSSTNSLTATIAAINAGKANARRDLAAQEASLQGQRKSQLINVNNQMIDEKDKAWNYNFNMPYQMKIAALRDQIKMYNEQSMQYASMAASSASSIGGSSMSSSNTGGGMGSSNKAASSIAL